MKEEVGEDWSLKKGLILVRDLILSLLKYFIILVIVVVLGNVVVSTWNEWEEKNTKIEYEEQIEQLQRDGGIPWREIYPNNDLYLED